MRTEISPREEGGAGVRYHTHDGDSEPMIEFEDRETGKDVFGGNGGRGCGRGRQWGYVGTCCRMRG